MLNAYIKGLKIGLTAAVAFKMFEVTMMGFKILELTGKIAIEKTKENMKKNEQEDDQKKPSGSVDQPVDYSEVFMSSKQDDDLK